MKNNVGLALFFVVSIVYPSLLSAENLPLNQIKLPPGFKIEIYADNVPNARSMTMGDQGTLFVGNRANQDVYAIPDQDGDHKGDSVIKIIEGMRSPNGVEFHDGSLYVAEISRVWRFESIEDNLTEIPKPKLIRADFPTDGWHGWKYIRFGPDGKLYIPVGAPCNICEKDDARYASIMRMNADGSDLELFASGIRNTVGFDWHPETQALWFTDNGVDNLGNDFPPDELNHAPKEKMHFGFPYCVGAGIQVPQYAKYPCRALTPPAQTLDPHVAALGMKFYTGTMFPEKYQNQIFIAEHGSWNRDKKIGYRVSLVRLQDNNAISYETFAEGWMNGTQVWGRPVDILILDDGSMLVSDDHGNAIYRITYQE
jgi:glucose/arabinose dehydrogenase